MSTVFIYYSLTGNEDLVASKLAEKGIDVRPVKLAKPMPKAEYAAKLTRAEVQPVQQPVQTAPVPAQAVPVQPTPVQAAPIPPAPVPSAPANPQPEQPQPGQPQQ